MARVVDAAQAGDAQAAKPHDARGAQVVDVGRHPAAVVQLPQVVGGLVVAANCVLMRQLGHTAMVAGSETRTQQVAIAAAVGW